MESNRHVRPKQLDEPIFLVGTTRSGTTLLSLMLDHHPEVSFIGEFEWPWDYANGPVQGPLTEYHTWLRLHRHFIHHRLECDTTLGFDELVRSFLAQMWRLTPSASAKAHTGCQIHRHYAQALALWPRARFVHIVRDGRDVCASWIKFGWTGNTYGGSMLWRTAIAEWEAVRPRIDPSRRIEVRFEDLITGPERELTRLSEFIGVAYDDRMLRYAEDTTYEKIDPSQAGKWAKNLSVRDVRTFEAIAGAELTRNGYTLSGHRPLDLTPLARLGLDLEERVRRNQARARTYGLGLWFAEHLTRRLHLSSLHGRIRLRQNDVENARLR